MQCTDKQLKSCPTPPPPPPPPFFLILGKTLGELGGNVYTLFTIHSLLLSFHMYFIGGIFLLLSYRLKQELERLASDKNERFSAKLGALQFKFHQPPAHPSTAAWLGGIYVFYVSYGMQQRGHDCPRSLTHVHDL